MPINNWNNVNKITKEKFVKYILISHLKIMNRNNKKPKKETQKIPKTKNLEA